MKLPCIIYSSDDALEFANVRVLMVRDEDDGEPEVIVEVRGTDRLGEPRWVDAEGVVVSKALEAALISMALTIDEQNGNSGKIDT